MLFDKAHMMYLPVQNEAKKRVQVVGLFMILKRKGLNASEVGMGKRFAFNENFSARTRYRRSGMPRPRVFGAARGDTTEVCRI